MLPTLIRPLTRFYWPGSHQAGREGSAPQLRAANLPPPHYTFPLRFYTIPCHSFFPPEFLLTAWLPLSAVLPSLSLMVLLAARRFRREPKPRPHSWALSKPGAGWPSPQGRGSKQGETMRWLHRTPSPGGPNINLATLGHQRVFLRSKIVGMTHGLQLLASLPAHP